MSLLGLGSLTRVQDFGFGFQCFGSQEFKFQGLGSSELKVLGWEDGLNVAT